MSRSKSAGGNEAYQSLVVLDGKFANSTTSLKSKYASGDSTKKTEIELNLNYLKRFGSLFAGPLIGYSSSSTSYGDDTSSSNTLDIGGLVDFPVADIDRAKTVPHVYAGARYNTELSGEDNKYSGYRFAVGAGAYFFLDRGIAIDLKFEFQKQLLKIDGDTGLEKDATNLIAGAGIAVFL